MAEGELEVCRVTERNCADTDLGFVRSNVESVDKLPNKLQLLFVIDDPDAVGGIQNEHNVRRFPRARFRCKTINGRQLK